MRSLARTTALCAAALIGCGGSATDPSDHRAGVAADGAASGGQGGNLPSSPPDASAGEAATSSDGAATACPIRVSGTHLTEADCYPCLGANPECVVAPGLPLPPTISLLPFTLADCMARTGGTARWCAWYADGAPVDIPIHVHTCKSSPGFVACGGEGL